jgi:hypothetical protein
MDAIPDKFYYVPLPRLPRLRMSDLARLPHLQMSTFPLAATIVRGERSWRRSCRATGTWLAAHTLDAAAWTLATAIGVVAGFAATVNRGRRSWQTGRRAAGTLCATHVLATLRRGRRSWHSGRRSVEMWWAAHALEAAVWTLGLAFAVGVGVVVGGL